MPLHDFSAAAASGATVLSDTILDSPASSFDISGITGGYAMLKVIALVRSSQAVVDAAVFALRFNNDSSAIYDRRSLWAGATSGAASQDAGFAGTQFQPPVNVTGDSAPSGRATNIEFEIPNYDGTTFHKSFSGRIGAPNVDSGSGYWQAEMMGVWRSTAAITQIQFICGASSNWMTGSRFTIVAFG